MQLQPKQEIPLCDIQSSYQQLQPEVDAAVQRVLHSGQVILGSEVAALEREVAAYCGIAHGIGCASGSDALLLALTALDLRPGDEVILPPFTFFATAGAICRAGALPVFADIDPQTFNIDPAELERKITARTRAILPVHLFGQCADMAALCRLAEEHRLPLIEDAAQAFGSEFQGKRAGALGAMGCFSFYPTKTLGTFGDGGMVVTENTNWAKKLACLRGHGMAPKYHHHYLGWNARLDALHAAILRVKLPHVENWIQSRQAAARRYDRLIAKHRLGEQLRTPFVRDDVRHTFNQYVVRVSAQVRDRLMHFLKAEKVGCEVYYPVPLHMQMCLAGLGYREGDFPVAEEACRTVLALPMFPELTAAQQEHVIQVCTRFFAEADIALVA
jgi:dTDP-4-amino-4,6-dideoxygalactose transaminase